VGIKISGRARKRQKVCGQHRQSQLGDAETVRKTIKVDRLLKQRRWRTQEVRHQLLLYKNRTKTREQKVVEKSRKFVRGLLCLVVSCTPSSS
jgi:hypothetical protein